MIPYKKKQFANGITLYTHHTEHNPLVCLEMMIQGGATDFHHQGVANLALNCLFKGSRSQSHTAFASQLENLGANLNFHCSPTAHTLRLEVLNSYFLPAFQLVWKALQQPCFAPEEVAKEKQMVISQLKTARENPAYLAQQRFIHHIYGQHATSLDLEGKPAFLNTCTPSLLHHFHQQYYVPSNLILSMSGNLSNYLYAAFCEALSDFETAVSSPPALEHFSEEDLPPIRSYQEHISTSEKEQCIVIMGHKGIRRMHPDFTALTVLDVLMSQGPGFSSRLPQRLREAEGLVYYLDFGTTQGAHLYPGVVQTYIECSPAKVNRCLQLIQEELERVQTTPISNETLQHVKSYLKGQLAFCFETHSQRAHYFLQRHRFHWSDNHLENYVKDIEEMTPDTLQRVARIHIKPQRQTLITAGSRSPLSC